MTGRVAMGSGFVREVLRDGEGIPAVMSLGCRVAAL